MTRVQHILSQVSEARIAKHVGALNGERHPTTNPEALQRAAEYVSDCLRSLMIEVSWEAFLDGNAEYRNIVGRHLGVTKPSEQLIVIAHFDTVAGSPGADDNASGVAVMLELARVLSTHRFQRTVLFVGANLEEQSDRDDSLHIGLRGSTHLAETAREENWQVLGVLNLEAIAYAEKTATQRAPEGLPVRVPPIGNFLAVIGNERSLEMVTALGRVIESHAIPLPYVPLLVPGNGEEIPDVRRSDHAPFWDVGYRGIMLTDTAEYRSPHYHQPSDKPETLNMHFAANVCRAAAGLVCEMARILEST